MCKEAEAIILAAGKGTRLNCGDIPKAMVEVGGKPLVGYPLNSLYLSRFNTESITVVVGTRKEVVINYCAKSTQIKEQPLQDGNLSAIESGMKNLPDRFTDLLIIHADDALNVSPQIISELLHIHESQNMAATLLLSHCYRDSAHRKQYLVDNSNHVTSIEPIDQHTGELNVFCGIYCLDRKFLIDKIDFLKTEDENEQTITPIFGIALKQSRLGVCVTDLHWQGINIPKELASARSQF